jgi:hypothetical protein
MFKVGDIVYPKGGPHTNVKHTVIYVTEHAVTLRPLIANPKYIQYRLGAITVYPHEVVTEPTYSV